MPDLQIFFLGLAKIIWNFRLVFTYIIFVSIYRRCKQLEKRRMAKVINGDKLEGVYHQKRVG